MQLNPCHLCVRPANIGETTGGNDPRLIGCFRAGCDCEPVRYEISTPGSKEAAIKVWNEREQKS